MKTTATNRKLRELLIAVKDEKLVLQAPFQRRLVWTTRHKLALIKTVLEGYPFPEVFLAAGEVDPNSGEAVELLVDGQQRISTLLQYFTGSDLLKLPKELCPYKDLPEEDKKDFLQYDVVVRDLGNIDHETIVEVFTRINSTSYDLNAIELHNARYDGAFKKFGELVANLDFFADHRVFTASDIRRMNDLRFALWIGVTLLSNYFHRDTQLKEFLNEYNDEFPHKKRLISEIRVVLDFINECTFPDSCRCWKKTDLFTLIVELQRAIVRDGIELNPLRINERLMGFYSKVDKMDPSQLDDSQISIYYKSALQASNDRSNRIRRGDIISELLRM